MCQAQRLPRRTTEFNRRLAIRSQDTIIVLFMRKAIWGSLTPFKMGALIQAPHTTPTSELSYSMPDEFTLNAQFLTAILVVVSFDQPVLQK